MFRRRLTHVYTPLAGLPASHHTIEDQNSSPTAIISTTVCVCVCVGFSVFVLSNPDMTVHPEGADPRLRNS